MNARPKLHEVGSLLKQKRAMEAGNGGPQTPIPLVSRKMAQVAEGAFAFDGPPVDVLDEAIDATLDAEVPENIFGSPADLPPVNNKRVSELELVAELTQADKIEAVCEKIDPEVRAFIEEELRGRFVAVRG